MRLGLQPTFLLTAGLGLLSSCGGSSGATYQPGGLDNQIIVLAGDNITAAVNSPFPARIKLKAQAYTGIGLPTYVVHVAIPASGPSGSFEGGGSGLFVTDAQGIVELPVFIANDIPGSYVMTATGKYANTVSVHLTNR